MRHVHMNPEEAIQAYRELGLAADGRAGAKFMPMHWGTFKLTDEPTDEPSTPRPRGVEGSSTSGW
jgi:hypothetical protein